ncbi:MAG TPA: ABC transporter permease [Ilumatobacteraceae bacterium]|nr:ABC transporter permease [Ilumatobacteraceae bacterium]
MLTAEPPAVEVATGDSPAVTVAGRARRSAALGAGALVSLVVLIAALYSWVGLTGNVRLFVALGSAALAARLLWAAARTCWPHVDLGLRSSAAWLIVLVTAAVFAGLLPLAEARDPSKTLTGPTLLRPDLFSGHPFGTDRIALDLLGGVLYGARVSMVVGLGAAAVGLLVGLPVGMAAGYLRGGFEVVIDFATNVMLAFPPIILLLAMVSVMRPSIVNVAVALGVISIPIFVRIAKLNTTTFASREFVTAAVAVGASRRRVLVRELLPCVLPPVLTYGVLVVAVAIVAEASLSFLGLSIQRPEPTWGNMIAAGRDSYTTNPHPVLVVTVLALNNVNQALRKRFDAQDAKL